jgi:hypothetical protein
LRSEKRRAIWEFYEARGSGVVDLNERARGPRHNQHFRGRRYLPEQVIQCVTTMVAILTAGKRVMLVAVWHGPPCVRGPALSSYQTGDSVRVEDDGQRARQEAGE